MKYIISGVISGILAIVALNAQDINVGENTEINAQENVQRDTQENMQDSMRDLENAISLPPLRLPPLEPQDKPKDIESSEDSNAKQYDFGGHVGIFQKVNLGRGEDKKDNYNAFSASLDLTYSVQDTLFFGLGIYAATPLYEYPKYNAINNYIGTKFLANTAYVEYAGEGFFDVMAGRYNEDRDWLRHYVQGVGIDVRYDLFGLWANWVDEQAHANREHLSDFDIYKSAYNGEFLWAGGINIDIPYLSIAPYYYAMNNYFWSVGGKLESKLSKKEGFGYTTTLHYVYLNAKANSLANHDAHDHAHSNGIGDSYIVWFDQEINYAFNGGSLLFGAGYLQVWKSYFELASIGNMSRFEIDGNQAYDVIEPGGLDNGINTSNMFDANTRTIYGFVGTEIGEVALMALLRNSKGGGVTQNAYSLGFKWNATLGVNIGGVGVYMLENKRILSFVKGYVEFRI